MGALRYELCPNADEKSVKDFPFVIREILVDTRAKIIRCLRTARIPEKSESQARNAFERISRDFKREYDDPLLTLTSAQEDVSKAHLIVCKDIFRKTMSYLRRYADSDSVEERQHFLDLANQEFVLERQSNKKQADSPALRKMSRNARRRVQKYNKVDREIVANWVKCYQFKDGATFAYMLHEATGAKVKPKVLRRRQQRLGLATHTSVPTGPKPKS